MTWTAGVNKFISNKTISEINRMAGRMKKSKSSQQQQQNQQQQQQQQQVQSNSHLQEGSAYLKEDLSRFPAEWNWNEKLNYEPEVRAQGDCGSCYAISTVTMVDYRIKIKYRDNQDLQIGPMSVQQVLDCNFYNQGCDGGYPSLVGKYLQQLFIVEDKYKQYKCNPDIYLQTIKHNIHTHTHTHNILILAFIFISFIIYSCKH